MFKVLKLHAGSNGEPNPKNQVTKKINKLNETKSYIYITQATTKYTTGTVGRKNY